jgi:hypothetical protein
MKFGGLVAGNRTGVACVRALRSFVLKELALVFTVVKEGTHYPETETINFEILSLYTKSNFQFC